MVSKDNKKIIKTIISIIKIRIPNKSKRLEQKYGIGIHTCNFSKKISLNNGEKINISINTYFDNIKDSNSSGTAHGSAYDIFIGDNETVYLFNSSILYDNYQHDLDINSEYFNIFEKVCGILNYKNKKNISSNIFELLSNTK